MLTPGVEPCETVAHERPDHHREDGRRRGDDEAVDQRLQAAVGEERGCIVNGRWLRREPDGRNRQKVPGWFDRGDDHPVEREEQEYQEGSDVAEAHDGKAQTPRRAGPEPRSSGHQAASGRSNRRTSAMITTVISARKIQLPAVACERWNSWKPV